MACNTLRMKSNSGSFWQNLLAFLSLGLFLCFLLLSGGALDGASGQGQRSGIRQGDRTFQRVADTVDIDERDDKLYRRPPTYLIIASKIVRPSTVYKVGSKIYTIFPILFLIKLNFIGF